MLFLPPLTRISCQISLTHPHTVLLYQKVVHHFLFRSCLFSGPLHLGILIASRSVLCYTSHIQLVLEQPLLPFFGASTPPCDTLVIDDLQLIKTTLPCTIGNPYRLQGPYVCNFAEISFHKPVSVVGLNSIFHALINELRSKFEL